MAFLALTASTRALHGVDDPISSLATQAPVHPMAALLALAWLLAPGLLLLAAARVLPGGADASPARAALLRALASGGGWLSASELASMVGAGRKTVAYHLHVLERAGLVVRHPGPGGPLYARAGDPRRGAPAARLLRNANRRALWAASLERPGATVPELARTLRMKASTAYFHARVLERAGLLRLRDAGGARGVVPAGEPAAPPAGAAPPGAVRARELHLRGMAWDEKRARRGAERAMRGDAAAHEPGPTSSAEPRPGSAPRQG